MYTIMKFKFLFCSVLHYNEISVYLLDAYKDQTMLFRVI
jgi:hypothetical protein